MPRCKMNKTCQYIRLMLAVLMGLVGIPMMAQQDIGCEYFFLVEVEQGLRGEVVGRVHFHLGAIAEIIRTHRTSGTLVNGQQRHVDDFGGSSVVPPHVTQVALVGQGVLGDELIGDADSLVVLLAVQVDAGTQGLGRIGVGMLLDGE